MRYAFWDPRDVEIERVIKDFANIGLATGPGLDQKNGSVRFQNRPKTQTAASWRAKPVPVPVNRRVLPSLARPVGSNLRFSFWGFSIYSHSQICYCYVQNMVFCTSLPLFDSLAAFRIKTRRDMLPATLWSWVCMISCLASLVRFEVQNSHIDR